MSQSSEAHIEAMECGGMDECEFMHAMEEQAYDTTVIDIAAFITSGAKTLEQFEKDLREALNGKVQ